MSDAKAALEALDQKVGRVHTIDDLRALSRKSAAAYTDDDLILVAYFSGEKSADEARTRRAKALEPPQPPTTTPTITTKATDAGTRFVTWSLLEKSFESYSEAIVDVLKEKRDKDEARNATLEARVNALENELIATKNELNELKAQPLLKDAGTWRHGSMYAPGDVALFKGCRWICQKAHTGSGSPDHQYWQLFEKTQ